MRTEQEMMNLILDFAKNDDCIRIVSMEGSKLNKNVPKDIFQDFDITFIVNDMEKYKKSDIWLDVFGKRIIMQKPEDMAFFPPTLGNWHSYLMVYDDGNKLDLKIVPINEISKYITWAGSLVKILLDKDNICPKLNDPSDIDFHIKKPSIEFIDDCCNEFWLLALYVSKGLCRNEILFAIKHLNLMKEQLFNMLSWKVGIETSFSLSVGKAYKFLDKFVSNDIWQSIMETYKNDTINSLWNSLIICCNIFKDTTIFVSAELNYKCPEYDKGVMEYIQKLKEKP